MKNIRFAAAGVAPGERNCLAGIIERWLRKYDINAVFNDKRWDEPAAGNKIRVTIECEESEFPDLKAKTEKALEGTCFERTAEVKHITPVPATKAA
jgi:hypothetical protein